MLESDDIKYEDEYRVKSPQPNFRLAHKNIGSGIVISAYPEISAFYKKNADYRLPFDLEEQMSWENLNQKFYDDTKKITSLGHLHNIILN